MSAIVLGIDPGFSALGWSVLDMNGDPHILAMGIVRTAKESAKARLLAVEDNVRRTREIVRKLVDIIRPFNVRAVAAEAMSFPRSASVAAKVALTWGVLVALTELNEIPLLQCTPQAVKRWANGTNSCSKEDVAFEVRKRCGNGCESLLDGVPAGLHEHAWDAAACALVCGNGDVVRALRGRAA